MSAGQRLPEDIAAEQAYVAELRAQQAAERKRLLAEQGLLDDTPPAAPAAPATAGAGAPAGGIAPEKLAALSPEALAALPAEVRELILEAQARQRQVGSAAPVAGPPPAPAAALDEAPGQDSQDWMTLPEASDTAAPSAGRHETPAPAAPMPPEGLSEEELARRERIILSQVAADMSENNSVLVRGRSGGFVHYIGAMLDALLGLLLGRNKTW
jgi:hypothetical protein